MSESRKQIKILWIKLSAYYQAQLRDEVLDMYAEDLSDLPVQKVLTAMNEYRRNPKHVRMPLPAQIRAICDPAVDEESLAKEAAARVIQAIKLFGYMRPDEAKEFIGDLGWGVVERRGGWRTLCEGLMEHEIPMFQAQARELAKAHLQLSKAGQLNKPIALPSSDSPKQLENIINQLTSAKSME